jgi:hypothetical protein
MPRERVLRAKKPRREAHSAEGRRASRPAAGGRDAGPLHLADLQQSLGNRTVQRLLAQSAGQALSAALACAGPSPEAEDT